MVESIPEDLRAFGKEGAEDRLVRAMNTFLMEASTVVSRMLPEDLGDWITAYLGALADAFDGVGDGIQAFEQQNETLAIESVYKGVEAAARGIVPQGAQNGSMFETIVAVLDPVIGQLSKHVLEYKKLVAESSVCWRGYASRARQRPKLCEDGFTWDGDQWCMFGRLPPYTLQNVGTGKFLNLARGESDEGANVHVWNDPSNANSQWRIRLADDGNYTIQNVRSGSYLHAAGVGQTGANVVASYHAGSPASRWNLARVGGSNGAGAAWTLRSIVSGRYVNLAGGSSRNGANVWLWDNPTSADSQWRIVSVWGGAPFDGEAPGQGGAALLEHAARAKRPQGALPARCSDSDEKRGSWCYEPCPAGYEPSGARCKVSCGQSYPVEAPLMCGRSPGTIAEVISRMISGTISRVVTISGLIASMQGAGLLVAGGLTGTMQALIDMGKPFAHPMCPA